MKSQAEVDAIVADYTAGVPVNYMIGKHCTSAESIRTYVRRAGLPPRAQVRRERGVCDACTSQRVLNDDGLCDTCTEEIQLTDGRWVRRGLTLMWVADPKPERQVPRELIACPKCRATVTESCRTKNGHRTSDHLERLAPRLCACGHPPKQSSRYCERCARDAAARVKRESYERAKRVAA